MSAIASAASDTTTQTGEPGKWVYPFGDGKADGAATMKNLLGGKGAK